jgi:hypothetical protein
MGLTLEDIRLEGTGQTCSGRPIAYLPRSGPYRRTTRPGMTLGSLTSKRGAERLGNQIGCSRSSIKGERGTYGNSDGSR